MAEIKFEEALKKLEKIVKPTPEYSEEISKVEHLLRQENIQDAWNDALQFANKQ